MTARDLKFRQYRSTKEELTVLDKAIIAACENARPNRSTIRYVFYQMESLGLVPKTDKSIDEEWIKPGYGTPYGSKLVARRISVLNNLTKKIAEAGPDGIAAFALSQKFASRDRDVLIEVLATAVDDGLVADVGDAVGGVFWVLASQEVQA